jgi:transketolase
MAETIMRDRVLTDNMRSRFAAVTTELLDTNPRLAVVLADVTIEQFDAAWRKHPERVINVGIREQLLISVGGGMAMAGLRPIIHTFAPFLIERPFEQVKLDINHQNVSAILVSAAASYDIAPGGRTHQGPADVALLDTLAGWTVHVPGHTEEADALLRAAIARDDRTYLRLTTEANREPFPLNPDGAFTVLKTGRAGTVIAVGPQADATVAATADLDVTLLYAATVRPFDGETLRATLGMPDVVLVEPYLSGTSVRHVNDALAGLPHRVLGLGVKQDELRRYGTPSDHQRAHGLDAASVRASITGFLGIP